MISTMDFSSSVSSRSFLAGNMDNTTCTKSKSKLRSTSLGHLSRSINSSFRVRKRKPREPNTAASQIKTTNLNKSGIFDIVNKSISYIDWESWSHEAALKNSTSFSKDKRQGVLEYSNRSNKRLNSTIACGHSASSTRFSIASTVEESCSEPSKHYYYHPRPIKSSATTRIPDRSTKEETPSKYRRVSSFSRQRLAPEGCEAEVGDQNKFNNTTNNMEVDNNITITTVPPAPPALPPRVPVIESRNNQNWRIGNNESSSNVSNTSRSYSRYKRESFLERRTRKALSVTTITETTKPLDTDTNVNHGNADALHVSMCGGLIQRTTGRVYGRLYAQRHCLNSTFTNGQRRSLAVHDEAAPPPVSNRLVTASSVNNMTRQADNHEDSGSNLNKPGRVAGWAVNFNKLLQDPIGLAVFTSFLKKEFSEENVIFWTACEQYRKISDEQRRKSLAQEIYGRHLSSKASDPVNVDSAAKLYTEKFLDSPTAIMFDVAQLQIFQLMRQDSYSRFLKSDMYKGYLVKEIEGQPLIDPTTGNPESTGKPDKKKGKGKENEEKRRRSILPWRQHKKSSMKTTSDPELKKVGKRSKEEKTKDKETNNSSNNNNTGEDSSNLKVVIADTTGPNPATTTTSVSHSKKVAGPGIDLSTMRKEVFHPKEVRDVPESQFKFCRIMLPDGSTTVVCAKPGQSCRVVLSKLCEKRSVALASVEVFLHGSNKPLDLEEDISVLGSKEIVIEKRVLFRLDMPNVKSIGVKAKPNRSVSEVFRPILQKYGFSLENITVYVTGSQDPVDLDESVSCLDKQRANIITTDSADMLEPASRLPLSARSAGAAKTGPASGSKVKGVNTAAGRGGGGGSLEEITNQIFDDLMRGKSQLAHGFDELGVVELEKAKVNKNEEGRSLGLFGLLRRESWGAKDRRPKGKGKVTFTLPGNDGKKKNKEKNGEKLIRLLSGAQELRLEDQRGIEISTGEMPSFLHDVHQDGKDSARVSGSSSHQFQPGVMEIHMEEDPNGEMTSSAVAGLERVMDSDDDDDDHGFSQYPNTGRLTAQQTSVVSPRGGGSNAWATSPATLTAGTATTTSTPRGRNEPPTSSSTTTTTMSRGVVVNAEKWSQHINNNNNNNKSFGQETSSSSSAVPSPNTASSVHFQMCPEVVEMQKPLINNRSPHKHSHSPHSNSQSPHNNNPSPHNNSYSPHNNSHSPHNNNPSPHSNSHSPHTDNPSPITITSRNTGTSTESHSFRPPPPSQHEPIRSVHSSFYPPTKAPVASPDRFSPDIKNSNSQQGAAAMMLLPSKMSPTSPSSNSSSSSSSSIKQRPSPASKHQPPPQNISRMSDGMLLHKLQTARKSNGGSLNNSRNPLSNSQQYSDSRNKRMADLAQRALLSPRFDDHEESHLDMTHSQRALLSPRLNQPFHNANMTHYNTHMSHSQQYNHQTTTPSPVRNTSSSFKGTTTDGESHLMETRPTSSAGPQFSSWHNKSFLLNAGRIESPYHSPVGKQGNFKTDYLVDAGETVTFV